MNIDAVKERITALEAAGELTIKERIYLYSMKEHIALKEQNAALAAENYDLKHPGTYLPSKRDTAATDAFLASLRAEAFNDLCKAFILHKDLAGLDDDDMVTVREANDAVLHCAEQLRSQSIPVERLLLEKLRSQSAPSPASLAPLSAALTDIIAERQRQQTVEGWTPEHDDQHDDFEMSVAAACYALNAHGFAALGTMSLWPWDAAWWKPTNPRRDLVKAAALIAAEIERIDRASQSEQVKGVQS